jgi:hypothetical protein
VVAIPSVSHPSAQGHDGREAAMRTLIEDPRLIASRVRLMRRRWRALLGVSALLLAADAVERRRSVRVSHEPPGFLVIQVDGLSRPTLERALARGDLPFLSSQVEAGKFVVEPWLAMAPPTTPASQAGMMHGHNEDIPGFRWYEKRRDRLLVANHPGDAAEIAHRQAGGAGILAPDGASIGNLMTGGARRTYLTMATVAEEPRAPGTIIRLRTFLVSPLNALRILRALAGQFMREVWQGRKQVAQRVWPRMHRGFDTAMERALLNGAVRILSTELTIAELRKGTPAIWVDFTGYDSVAHHAGPERPESMQTLRGIDQEIKRIVEAIPRAWRPYQFVILSDHGQSLGVPFVEEYGEALEDFVAGAMGEGVKTRAPKDTEHHHSLAILSQELLALVGMRPILAGLNDRVRAANPAGGAAPPELVVCASGNLAHLYFTVKDQRLTREEIEQAYPNLVATVANHPAVGLALVRTATGSSQLLTRTACRDLDGPDSELEPVLMGMGRSALESLRRLDRFSNVGDLVLMSRVEPATAEVISFEDLVGCHGGFGGAQSEPFILRPAEWPAPATPLIGAPAVYGQLRTWRDEMTV